MNDKKAIMTIKQFKDEPLAHYSYAIVSEGEMALVDPSRNPLQYYKFAEEQAAKIVAVLETHPHADFVSGHLQISQETGAPIYISEKVRVNYKFTAFDEGQTVKIGNVNIRPVHTPGHSPDSLTFVAQENGETVLFTGDTLLIGDVGRPDLRENAGNTKVKRVELAKAMYQTLQTKYNEFPDDTVVYPGHGAGSLCGKTMSDANSSTMGDQRKGNWAFQEQTEEEFVQEIMKGQPFIPSYFGFNVDLNRDGVGNLQRAKGSIPLKVASTETEENVTVVDVRNGENFKKGHLANSINIMARSQDDKYETWLGAIIQPEEPFYLVVESVTDIDEILERTAKIGYEEQVKAVMTLSEDASAISDKFNLDDFRTNKEKYTIVDIRNNSELTMGKIFESAIAIPLNELRQRADQIPTDKPIVVHCAGGYRSAAGSSILESTHSGQQVFDLSQAVTHFK